MLFPVLGPVFLGGGFAAYAIALFRARGLNRLPSKNRLLGLLGLMALGCLTLAVLTLLGRTPTTFPIHEALIAVAGLTGLTALGLASSPSAMTQPRSTSIAPPPVMTSPVQTTPHSSSVTAPAATGINPLAMILMRAETLKSNIEGGARELTAETSPHLRRQLDRLDSIVNELKNLANDLDNEPVQIFSLEQILRDSLSLHEQRITKDAVKIEMYFPLDLKIKGQQGQLTQVFVHLISNSLDAIRGSESPWIKIEAHSQPDTISIQVIDSGNRITDGIAQRLMDPFFTTKPVGKGAGLGLSIAKGILEKHRGTLLLDRHSPNTCFTVELPVN